MNDAKNIYDGSVIYMYMRTGLFKKNSFLLTMYILPLNFRFDLKTISKIKGKETSKQWAKMSVWCLSSNQAFYIDFT